MSEIVPQRRIRAGDVDRDAVLELLQNAHAAGRLDVEELGERQDAALRARYTDELTGLVEDLPEGQVVADSIATPVVPSSAAPPANWTEASWSLTLMSGRDVVVPPGMVGLRDFALWGGNDIFLGDVMGPGVVVTLELHAIMAGHDIYVPPGVRVIDECLAVMAGNDIDRSARGDGSNGTLVRRGFLFWAGHDIHLQR